jgi:transposase
MFVSPSRIYLYRQFVDFRKSINVLSVIIESEIDLPIMSDALFIFCNRTKDKLKILYWDKTGFALWSKRGDIPAVKKGKMWVVDLNKEAQ